MGVNPSCRFVSLDRALRQDKTPRVLKARIHVDLKSVVKKRERTIFDWFRSVLGQQARLLEGREETTVGTFALIQALIRSFTDAGLTNVIAFEIDDKTVYLDSADVDDDLARIEQLALDGRFCDHEFDTMHLALTHHGEHLHTMVDVEVHREVLLRQPEVRVDISARFEDLRITEGETAAQWQARIYAFAKNENNLTTGLKAVSALAKLVATALEHNIQGARVIVESVRAELIRPTVEEMMAFPELPFGDDVLEPRYRPEPKRLGFAKYAVPFYAHYFDDPYHPLLKWLLLESLHNRNTWRRADVHVIDPSGDMLFSGDGAKQYPFHHWEGHKAVKITDDGLHISRDLK